MRDRVAELLPALDGPCLHSATCMYSNTPDEHFVIARHPDSDERHRGVRLLRARLQVRPRGRGDPRRPRHRRRHRPSHLVVRPEATGDHMTRQSPSARATSLPTLAGDYYTSRRVFAAEQERIFESMWFCAVRSSDLALAGQVQEGPGRPRERAAGARPRRTAAGVPQRLPAPRCPAVHRGRGAGETQPALPVSLLDLRAGRQADGRAQHRVADRRRPARRSTGTEYGLVPGAR